MAIAKKLEMKDALDYLEDFKEDLLEYTKNVEKLCRKYGFEIEGVKPHEYVEKAYEYLDSALSAIRSQGGWIHYYDFEHARKPENPIEKAKAKVAEKLKQQNVTFELPYSRTVRQTGPNWYQIAIDIQIKK